MMEFFNFGNDPTYHCFVWLTEGGTTDIPALVKKAFDLVEGDDWFKMGEDVSTVAQDKLAELLEDHVCETLGLVNLVDGPEIGGAVSGSAASLTDPLLMLELQQINFSVIALAILMQQGKWNPDKSIPEVS